jgi:hypothetical protein
MKLQELAKKPQLIKKTITEEKIVQKYGDVIDFYMYDRYEMSDYIKLINTEENDIVSLSTVVKRMVMDETGRSIVSDGEIIPTDILMQLVKEVVNHLGNVGNQTLVA